MRQKELYVAYINKLKRLQKQIQHESNMQYETALRPLKRFTRETVEIQRKAELEHRRLDRLSLALIKFIHEMEAE
jgi:hypothetical protein